MFFTILINLIASNENIFHEKKSSIFGQKLTELLIYFTSIIFV